MKNQFAACGAWLVLGIFLETTAPIHAADFAVTNSSFVYFINGARYPTLTLVRGLTYTFDVQTSSLHPLHIESPGASNNDISSGVITVAVPTNSENFYYECVVHGEQMRGNIVAVTAPRIEILNLSVGTNLVLTSTATNNWSLQPEYTPNLTTTNWFALTVQTNRLVNGRREIICGRPPDDSVFIRLKAMP